MGRWAGAGAGPTLGWERCCDGEGWSPRRGAARCSLVFCVATPARPQQCGGRLHAGEHEEIHRRKLGRNGDHHLHLHYIGSWTDSYIYIYIFLYPFIVYDIKQLSIMAHDSLWAWKILYSGEKSVANSCSWGPKELPLSLSTWCHLPSVPRV